MANHLKPSRAKVVVGLILVLAAIGLQAQVRRAPDGELAVAYRQRENGKLSQQVFQNWLECSAGECTLTTLTLGQCIAGAFYPKLQRWTTRDGSLSTDLVAPGVLHAEFKEGGATFQLRFTFESSGRRFGRLREFSGGVVKQSDVLNRVITWELVPLRVLDSTVKFDCPASLDFVRE